VRFDDLIATCDIISVARAGEKGRAADVWAHPSLPGLKPTATFVNTARGGLVGLSRPVPRLARRQIAGAALDVYGMESH
jgi:lactate dehydrogenase-like 2-hydroxyacid dehydrogenase